MKNSSMHSFSKTPQLLTKYRTSWVLCGKCLEKRNTGNGLWVGCVHAGGSKLLWNTGAHMSVYRVSCWITGISINSALRTSNLAPIGGTLDFSADDLCTLGNFEKSHCIRCVKLGPFIHHIYYIKQLLSFLISNFCHVLNVVCFLLGNSLASEFYMPLFRNTLSVQSSYAGRCAWN